MSKGPRRVQDGGLMPSSRMGGGCPAPSRWQEGSCLCGLLKPPGTSQLGLGSPSEEAWAFLEPKSLPGVTKK